MDKILPIPEGLQVEESSQSLVISYRWYKLLAWFLVFFALIWNGFMVGWFLAPTPLEFKLFGSIHVAVGIGLAWYVACLFFNTTNITITKYELKIVHSPIPFPTYRNTEISRNEIKQIYIVRKTSTRKGGDVSYSFALQVLGEKGISKKLSVDCEDYEKAIFIKRKIEQYMRIEPQAIEGEYLE